MNSKPGELTASISSTALDLPEHRKMVVDACLRMGVVPISFDNADPLDVSNLQMNLDRVRTADIFIGIYAYRYGFVPTVENPEMISIAEMEFNVAKEINIPRLVFLMHESHQLTQLQVETGPGAEKLEKFKQRLRLERYVTMFKSPDELKAEVIAALALIKDQASSSSDSVSSAPDPSTSTSTKEDDAEEGTVSFSTLSASDFTEGANAVIKVARRLGTGRPRPEACSVRRLLASLMLWGLDDKEARHTGRWLVSKAEREEGWVRKQLADSYPVVSTEQFSFPAILDSQNSPASFMTSRLREVIELARRLATESRAKQEDRRIAARHLLAAAVARAYQHTNVERFLQKMNLDMAEVRAKLIEDLWRWDVGDDAKAYRRILDAFETPEELRGLPVYAADSATGDDLIGITREVEAMASLVSAWSVEPPLSVGLFGEWGSGKSFFMEKMQERVWQIAAEARKSKLGQREFGYYKNIVQVKFNAWHYVEGNLWASLVEHIFSDLRLSGTDDPDRDVDTEEYIQARLEKLLNEVKDKSSRVQQQEQIAAQASKEAQTKTEEAEKEAKRLEDEALAARSRAETLEMERRDAEKKAAQKQRDADESILKRESIGLKDVFEVVAESSDVRTVVEKDLAELGITKDRIKTAQGLQEAIREASEAGTVLHKGIRMLADDQRRWILLVWVIATPVLVAALVWLGAYLLRSQNAPWMQAITGLISTVAFLAGGIVGFWKQYSPKLRPILDAVEHVRQKRDELDRQVEEVREQRAARAVELDKEVQQKKAAAEAERQTAEAKTAAAEQARQEAEQKRRDAERAAAEADSAKAELEKMRAEAEALRPERRIAAFIQDRARAQDYRRHLGVPALIRRDFEKLSKMFRTQREYEKEDRDGAQLETRHDPTIVNRIILYIDDLDRCPPEKVVEVLRAIHLLLAFPLFVVIVAVDARWMKRALRDRFALMLRDRQAKGNVKGKVGETSDSTTDPIPTATTDDYLEKIFQVPFWIRPLGVKACENLVNALTKDDVGPPGVDQTEVKDKTSTTPPSPKPPPPPDSAAPSGGGSTAPNQNDAPVNQAQPASHTQPLPKFQWSVIEPKPRSLQLFQDEREYMVELASLIGRSPRSVKRFVNCYRLLKSALDKDEQASVIRDGTFRSTMLLLGLVTGLPDVAPELLTHLRQSPAKLSPVAWLHRAGEELELKQLPWWRDLLPVVERLGSQTGVTSIRPLVQATELVDRFSFSPVRAPPPIIVEPNASD